MCMEDVRIGRKANPIVRTVALDAAAVQLAPFNPNRIALIISNPSTTFLSIGQDNTVTVGNGLGLVVTGGNLVLNVQQHGQLVFGPFWGIVSAPGSVAVWEAILEDK